MDSTSASVVVFQDSESLSYQEYFDFLKRTDLGSQYPRQNFEERVSRVLKEIDICITARTSEGLLVGICFGLTDFAYFLFLTDLGVDRNFVKQGIGRELVKRAHAKAGGEADITITTIANSQAFGFYNSCGMKNTEDLFVKFCEDWEEFVIE